MENSYLKLRINIENFPTTLKNHFGVKVKILDILKEHNAYICGGFLVGALLKCRFGDLDVYFPDQENFNGAEHALSKLLANEYLIHPKVIITENATTFVGHCQLIKKKFGTVQQILDTFDLDICRLSYEVASGKLFIDSRALRNIANQTLTIDYSRAISLERINKYKDRTAFKTDHLNHVLSANVANAKGEVDLFSFVKGGYGDQAINFDVFDQKVSYLQTRLLNIFR